ncbi:MAG: hypothetical protein J5382_08755 [Bacteroidales bacterium]|nr:hypothetical protein [Bacteroidales bacterium]
MKRFINILLLLAALAAGAVSCTVPRYVSAEPAFNDEWVGRSYSEIVQTFGAPDREVSDGQGGSIVVYEGGITEYLGSYYPGPTIIRRGENYMQYFVDEDGTCYKVLTDRVIQDGRRFYLMGTISLATFVASLLVGLIASAN